MISRILLGATLSLAIAFVALRRGSLTPSGAAAALAIGTGIYAAGGGPWFAALIAFFVSSTALGRAYRARKHAVKLQFEKGDTRDARQALANGGVAVACALGMLAHPSPLWAGAFLGTLSTANADTWATELGVLSRHEPFSLLHFERVPRGTSGAVSMLGLLASAGGALVIGCVAAAFHSAFLLRALPALALALGSGLLGSLTDSLLGATLQAGYYCPRCTVSCEGRRHHCGAATTHVRGLLWFDNDLVNLGATLAGALSGALIASLFAAR